MGLIVLLLIIFLLLGVTGAVVEGMLWLLVVAAILFVVTGVLGRGRFSRGGPRT
jgi:hypothetical protein